MASGNNMYVLQKIRESKAVLFGAFSDRLTKGDKLQKWSEVHEAALSLGVIPANKDRTYVRDTFWPNIKRATMAKIDNARKTGSAGGVERKLTELDHIVLDIVGRESPSISSLGVSETWEDPRPVAVASTSWATLNVDSDEEAVEREENNIRDEHLEEGEKTHKTSKKRAIASEFSPYGSKRRNILYEEYMEMKKQHVELTNENLNLKIQREIKKNEKMTLQNHKLKLDIRKLEEEMGIATEFGQSLFN